MPDKNGNITYDQTLTYIKLIHNPTLNSLTSHPRFVPSDAFASNPNQ